MRRDRLQRQRQRDMVWSMTRRTILGGLAAAAAANLGRAAARSKIRLGGPVFGKHDDPRELARAHRELGYSAAYCPEAKLEDKERIRAIEEGFKAEGVVISEVGAWKNLLDPDGEKRKQNFDYVATRLALAEAVGRDRLREHRRLVQPDGVVRAASQRT